MASGLPIKILVLTIVGMAGLGAMMSVINNGERAIPGSMHANINGSSLIILSTSPDVIEIPIEVINSRDGTPVTKASAVLFGLNATAINMTNNRGDATLIFNKGDFDLKSSEGYLSFNVKAAGFQDYKNDFAIKIVK